jgi:hypothetical protein
MGDFNLDIGRKDDVKYGKRSLLKEFLAAMSTTGLEYLPTPVTWHSYGRFQDGQVQRHSTVDHCYTLGVSATVRVLPDATTDHQPLLLFVNPARISGNSNSTKTIKSHNFKAIRVGDFESALDRTWNWVIYTGFGMSTKCTPLCWLASQLHSTRLSHSRR